VDANPLSPSYWGRLSTPIEPVITDISCCLGAWSDAVKQCEGNWLQTLDLIRALGRSPVPAYAAKTDALLSLNILSQLDVGWQEAVEPILQKRFGSAFVRTREQEWLDAMRPASQALAQQHLLALELSGAQSVLLIADVEYVEYTGRKYHSKQYEPPPLQWSEAGWRADPGIRFEVTQALEGVGLDVSTFHSLMPNYQLEWQDSWLWHIAPNGTEATHHGKLHRVAAFSLHRDA
jgi:hypothetical protein